MRLSQVLVVGAFTLAASLALAVAQTKPRTESASAGQPLPGQVAPVADVQFFLKASAGNLLEIEEGELALKQATAPDLKNFAQMMIDDHRKAQDALQAAAQSTGIGEAGHLDAPHQAMLDNLKAGPAADFDKIYRADQIQAHGEAAALLADYKLNGKNAKLKAWAEETLPRVLKHRALIGAM